MMHSWIKLDVVSRSKCLFYRNPDSTQFLKLSENPNDYPKFEREFLSMKKLEHRLSAAAYCFPHYYNYGRTPNDGNPFLIMEYLPGMTLADYLTSKRNAGLSEPRFLLEKQELYNIYHQIYDALRLTAQNHILSFDVSADNVIVDFKNGQPQIKLIDFSSYYDTLEHGKIQICNASSRHISSTLGPSIALLQMMMLLFIRLQFSDPDAYNQFLRHPTEAQMDFFTQNFGTIFDLVLARHNLDFDAIRNHASVHEKSKNCDPLYYLKLWFQRFETQIKDSDSK